MATIQFFDKLITLPLFVGMSSTDLETTIEKTKFEFIKADAGTVVIRESDRSGQLLLLVDGEVEMTTRSENQAYSVVEYLKAPLAVQPEHVFGLSQRHTCTLRTTMPSNFITISKNEALRLTSDSLIFRLNLLNLLSTSYQKCSLEAWRSAPQSLRERVVRFLFSHVVRPSGRKTFFISMKTIADELNSTRNNVSQVLNQMSQEGLLTLRRSCIEVEAIENIH